MPLLREFANSFCSIYIYGMKVRKPTVFEPSSKVGVSFPLAVLLNSEFCSDLLWLLTGKVGRPFLASFF